MEVAATEARGARGVDLVLQHCSLPAVASSDSRVRRWCLHDIGAGLVIVARAHLALLHAIGYGLPCVPLLPPQPAWMTGRSATWP